MNFVARCVPFHSTTARLLKPEPLIVSVNAPPPAFAVEGESDDATGAALAIAAPQPANTAQARMTNPNVLILSRFNNHLW